MLVAPDFGLRPQPCTQTYPEPFTSQHCACVRRGVRPVLFAYGGWQTASFMTGEMRNPGRDLARALLLGVIGVTAIYLSVNVVCLRTLGPDGLAATVTPAFTVMQKAIGERGALFMAITIAVSTLGFLSQGMLTAPRVYFAMARDGLFFRWIAWLPKSTRAPVAAIALQGLLAVDYRDFRALRADLELCRLDRFHFLRADRSIALCVPAPNTGCARTSNARASVHHYLFCSDLLAGGACHVLPLSGKQLFGLGLLLLGIPVYFYWSRRQNCLTCDHPRHGLGLHGVGEDAPNVAFNLANSGVKNYPFSGLPVDFGSLTLSGPGAYGYAPLIQAIAAKCGVEEGLRRYCARYVHGEPFGHGRSIEPGDDVLIERPAYPLLVETAEYLGCELNTSTASC